MTFDVRYGYSFGTSDPTYNAGVYAVDLVKWRKEKVVDEVHFWMKQVQFMQKRAKVHLFCRIESIHFGRSELSLSCFSVYTRSGKNCLPIGI